MNTYRGSINTNSPLKAGVEKLTPKKQQTKLWLAVFALMLVVTSACGQLQVGVEAPSQTSEAAALTEITEPDYLETLELIVTPIAEATVSPKPVEVIAWRGKILSLPGDSQYDDFVVLQPAGTGELGIQGSTAELESEIRSLRDADPPNDSVLIWGTLNCPADDYNSCRIDVDRLQYGPVHTSGEIVDGWVGKITASTFNQGISYIFVLEGDYPMWYSLHASQDPALQEMITSLRDTGSIVEVRGELLTGVPDVNGTRIEASLIGVIEDGSQTPGPLPDSGMNPTDSWQTLVNDRYGYEISYPPEAQISFIGPMSFPTEELPEGMSIDQYMESLTKLYTDKLCISIQYGLGYVNISAPENEGFKYAICGRTGVGAAEIIQKSENLEIDGQVYRANGMEVVGAGESLENHNETFVVTLDDGTRIEYGASPNAYATYEDYLMKTRGILMQMVMSYKATQ